MEDPNGNLNNLEEENAEYYDPNDNVGEYAIEGGQLDQDDEMMDEDDEQLEEGGEGEEGEEEEEDFVDESVQGFFEHTDSVYCVAVNKAFQDIIATGGGDDIAYLWDLNSGEKVHQLKGHSDSISSIAFNYDGKLLATGGMDGIVKIWDVQTGALQINLEGPTEAIEWIQWHSKGNVLLAGSADCLAFMWSTAKGDVAGTFAGHSGPVTCGKFTPDGKKVVTGSEDGSVKVWNPKDSSVLMTFSGHGFHENIVASLDIRKDSSLVLSGGDDHFAIISNINTGKVIGKLHGHTDSIVAVSMSNNNMNFCHTGSLDGTIKVWDINQQQQRSSFKHKTAVTQLKSHPIEPLLFSSSVDKTVCVWDERNGQLIKQFRGHQDAILDFDITDDGKVVTGSDDKVSLVFSLNTPQ